MPLPTITAPASILVDEDSGAYLLTGISVADADGDTLTLTISAEGLLAFGTVTGLTFTTGDGSAANTMTFSGSVADINAALATLTYAPASNDDDGDSIAISVADGTQVVSGPGTFAATFELSSLLAANGGDGSTGFVLNGIDASDASGRSVSSAGDVNGDGIDDIIIGAFGADPNGSSSGESYVVFGSSAGFGASFDLSTLAGGDGSTGFVLNGIDGFDYSGFSVSSAGDVNGDGIDDLIIGARTASPNGSSSGESYVVFGSSTGFGASLDLSTLDGTNGFVLNGIDASDQSGSSVSSAGDVNGDGIGDLIIGARLADPNNTDLAGESYVVFGSSTGFGSSFDLSTLASGDGSTGFVLNGIDANDRSGVSVSSAGDVNGDGIDDLIIGAYGGDPSGNATAGESYVVFGSSTGFGATFDLSTLASGDGSAGFILNGIDAYDFSGRSVSSAGDVNGDGIDDLIIGAENADPNGSNSGETYVVFGSSAGFAASFDLSTLASGDGSTGFILNGIDANDRSGVSVSSAGDVNGDGIDDLIIGAYGGDPSGNTSAGESYVVFGSNAGFGASLDLSTLDGTNGFVLNGIDAYDIGQSVSSAGDVNGDGIDDLIIGANGADPNGNVNAGESYVVFGRADFSDVLVNGSLTVNITPENDVPTIAGDQAIAILEGGSIVLTVSDFIGTDIDDDDATLTYAVSNLVAGTVQVGGTDVATFTAAQLAAGDVSFAHDGSETLSGSFDVAAVDNDGASSAAITIAATVTSVNDLPTINPAAITVAEDSSAALVAGLSVADAEDDILTVTLSAEGDLALGVLTGLTFITGDGSSANTMTFSGSVADINAALATLTYAPASNDDDGDSIAISVTDGTQAVTPGIFAATFELSSLLAANGGDGSTGFVLNGIDPGDYSGRSVSAAGDVNGDGIDDLIIGASSADPNGSSSGESYVVFGSSAGFGASFELFFLAGGDGSTGFVLNGIDGSDFSGRSVSSAGDINGDGIDDLIIGASGADPNGSYSGESYVVFGSSAGFGASFELSTLDGTNGFVLNGIDDFDAGGGSVSSAGDVNGDGIDDLIIGALSADPNGSGSGESYVLFGSSAGFSASFDLSTLNGTNGFVINGIDANDGSGRSVTYAGDVNGDGIDDLIIGAIGGDPNGNSSAGESYVVFGSSTGFGASLDLSTLDGTNGFVLNGIDAVDFSGFSVSSAGDVNGDGIDDLIIGASGADPSGNSGAGESYVVFGSSTGFGASFDLSTLASGDGSTGFVLNGIDAGDLSGRSVSSAGDVNGDGIDDLIIGASGADPNGSYSGESYVVFGSSAGFGASFDLSTLDGTNGFVLNGIEAFDSSGFSVSSAGDVNGDGIDDLIIGAYSGDPNGAGSGESYVIFGRGDFSDVLVNGALTVNITPENDAPVVTGDQLILMLEGGSIVLSSADLVGTDIEDDDAMLTYVVSNIAAGTLQVASVDVTTFTAAQLAAGDVSFVHDGSEDAGAFDVTAVDGEGINSNVLTVYSFVSQVNDAPVLSGDQVVIVEEGGSVILTSADLLGADADDDVFSLVYTVNNLDAGTVQVGGISVTTFTGAQLLAGDVNFKHDGSETPSGAFDVSVADDEGLSSAAITIAATVTPVNDAPVLSGDFAGSLNDGGAYVLTPADLSVSDIDDATSALVFTVSNVVNGTVLLNGSATQTFTLADIDAGLVSFRHDASATADGSFDVTAADEDLATSAVSNVTMTALGPVVQDGTSGVDDLDGGDANDYIRGLDDNDRIDGFEGNDQLFGNAGDDTLVGGNGDDVLNGGAGEDLLIGGAGADFMDGRGGSDLASYKTATSGIVLDLINGANNTGDAAGDTFANIAAFEGTRFNDTMTGDDNTNRMFGLEGDDTLSGGGANDRLLGGDGNDTLNGDDGADLLYGDDGDDILNGGNGRDVLVGGDGADTFNGGADIDRVTYKPSDAGVTIDLTNAANSTGDALGDTFNSIELIEGSQFDDVFVGTGVQDRLFGLDGVDQMMAGAGNDLLEGGNGNDILDGGADADILRGGEGNDTLTGGTGKDRFQFGGNEGADTITDFNQGELDRMQFTDASGVESMADLTIVQQGDDTLITYAYGSILLQDITATDLAAADFSFL